MKTIGFCNQKGGCGKTTLTIFLASFLHYNKGKRVVVLDCDYPQLSLMNTRNRNLLAESESGISQQNNKSIFAVYSSKMEDLVKAKKDFAEQGYDYMLVDLPGSASNNEMMRCVSQLDTVFIPLETEQKAAQSTYTFAAVLANDIIRYDKYPLNNAYFLWSKFIEKENTTAYDYIKTNLFAPFKGHIKFLDTHFKLSVAYKNSNFCNTLDEIDQKIITKYKLNINELLEEIVQKIENNE